MRTRSGTQYPKTSMIIDTKEQPSSICGSLCHPRNLKRRRHPPPPEKQPMSLEFVIDTFPLDRYWKKSKVACKRIEREYQADQRIRSISPVDSAIKRSRNKNQNFCGTNFFEQLHDDLVIVIMSKLSASASSPSDIINARLACKRFHELGHHPWVLAKASTRSLSVHAKLWSEPAHRFLKMCADAGNMDACYILGMIYFYCLDNRRSGAAYMAKAAMRSHPSALYSLAVIQFNGSGGSKSDKNLPAGVTLCARAAHLGHLDALRELGYCLQDGYGVRRDAERGRRFLCQSTALELSALMTHFRDVSGFKAGLANGSIKLDFGSIIQVLDPHPANRFLVEWSASREATREEGIRACSHVMCGRVETRRHEFRRCSVCGKANYCSRACQAMDWKRAHREECVAPPPDAEGPLVGDLAHLAGMMPEQGLID